MRVKINKLQDVECDNCGSVITDIKKEDMTEHYCVEEDFFVLPILPLYKTYKYRGIVCPVCGHFVKIEKLY
jgi:DNA-directed RNA polymerase subunit RPC12/RpoP